MADQVITPTPAAPAVVVDPAKPAAVVAAPAVAAAPVVPAPAADPAKPAADPAKPAVDPAKPAEPVKAKEGEAPKDGEKPKEGEKPKPEGAPEAYADFTLPEGVVVDAPAMTEFQGLAKQLDLSQEQAQRLVDFQGGKIKEMVEAPYKAWNDLQTKWQSDIKADPEIGGAQHEDKIAIAARVFDWEIPGNPFCKTEAESKALREALIATGAGNNPSIVRAFFRAGSTLPEPRKLVGGKPVATNKSAAETLYPNSPHT